MAEQGTQEHTIETLNNELYLLRQINTDNEKKITELEGKVEFLETVVKEIKSLPHYPGCAIFHTQTVKSGPEYLVLDMGHSCDCPLKVIEGIDTNKENAVQ